MSLESILTVMLTRNTHARLKHFHGFRVAKNFGSRWLDCIYISELIISRVVIPYLDSTAKTFLEQKAGYTCIDHFQLRKKLIDWKLLGELVKDQLL